MCNLSKGIREESEAIGIAKGEAMGVAKGEAMGELKERLKNVRALMKNFKVSAQEAMKILEVPSEEQQKLLPLL